MFIVRSILGIALCLLSIGAFASGDTAAAIIVLGVGLSLIIYNMTRKKKSEPKKLSKSRKPKTDSPTKTPVKQGKPSKNGIEYAEEHFGKDWKKFLATKNSGFNTDTNFLDSVALAYGQLSKYEAGMLALAFLEVNTQDRQEGKTLNISFSLDMDYTKMYESIFQLIRDKKISTENIAGALRQIIKEQETKAEAKEAERKGRKSSRKTPRSSTDHNIIDVSDEGEDISEHDSNPREQEEDEEEFLNYDLGKKYGKKMNLTPQELKWLSKIFNPDNSFLSIESCSIATIRLYLDALHAYVASLKLENKTLQQAFDPLITKIVQERIQRFGITDRFTRDRVKEEVTSSFYFTIFRRAEIVLREVYHYKGKLSVGFYPTEYRDMFDAVIGNKIDQIIQGLRTSILPADENTNIQLNENFGTRWKKDFESLTENIDGNNVEKVLAGIYKLAESNKKNSSLETIYFEGSKAIAKFDRIAAIKLYVYYLHTDLRSQKVDNKQLNKTIQKSIFKTNEELHEFERVISELVKDRDLKKALSGADKIFEKKRKRINLDQEQIAEVREQHSGTVEILSEVLDDDFEDDNNVIKSKETNAEEIQITIQPKSTDQAVAQEESVINTVESNRQSILNTNQQELLRLFQQQKLELPAAVVETFARTKNEFPGRLIDSINEVCYEELDDVLIEQEGDLYTINEEYFNKIIQHD